MALSKEEVRVHLRLQDEFSKAISAAGENLDDFQGDAKGSNEELTLSFTEVNQAIELVSKAMQAAGRVWDMTAGLILENAEAAAEYAAEVGNLSKELGRSITEIQELQHVAEISDVSFQKLVTGQKVMARNARDAAMGVGESVSAFKDLDVELKRSDGSLRGAQNLMIEVGSKLAAMTNETERTALAMRVLGRAGTEILPAFTDGLGAFEALRKEAHELGIVMDQETITEFRNMKDEISRLNEVWTALVRDAVRPFVGDIEDVSTAVRKFLQETGPLVKVVAEDVATLSREFFKLLALVPDTAAGIALISAIPGIGAGLSSLGRMKMILREIREEAAGIPKVATGSTAGPAGPDAPGVLKLNTPQGLADIAARDAAEAAEIEALQKRIAREEIEAERQGQRAIALVESEVFKQIALQEAEQAGWIAKQEKRTEQEELEAERQEERRMLDIEAIERAMLTELELFDLVEREKLSMLEGFEGVRNKLLKKNAIERLKIIDKERISEIKAEATKWGQLASIAEIFGGKQTAAVRGTKAIQAGINAHAAATEVLATPGLSLTARFIGAAAAYAQGISRVRAILSGGQAGGGGGIPAIDSGGGGGGGSVTPPTPPPGVDDDAGPQGIINLTIVALDPKQAAETLAPELEEMNKDDRFRVVVNTG